VSALRLAEFAKRYADARVPGTHAMLRLASGKVHPDVPGADFPDPEAIPYEVASCGLAQAERRAVWQRWAALEPRLGAAPLAAATTPDFLHALMAAQQDATRAARGVTWVSPRVLHLAMLEGFCAIEVQDWARAIDFLTRAMSLEPTHPNARLELSLALTSVGRNDEALKLADSVIAMAEDACTAARAWRRRGYVLVELDSLRAARAAYEKSLEIEPGNHVALKELQTIDAAMKQGKSVKDIPELVVPPGGRRTWTTSCKPAGVLN
jgi:tetratricopeptide (TPR) repeat protein